MGKKDFDSQPDKVLAHSNTVLNTILRYRNPIIGVLCAVIATVGLWTVHRYFAGRTEAEALASMYETFSAYQILSREKGPSTAYEAVRKDFERILDQYAGRHAAKLSRVIYAGICYDAARLDQAGQLYQKALSDFNQEPYKSMVLSGLAYTCEAKKDYQKAVVYFEAIVSEDGALMKSEALFGLGRLYELMGEMEKSRNAYQRLVADDPDSIYFDMAKEKIL